MHGCKHVIRQLDNFGWCGQYNLQLVQVRAAMMGILGLMIHEQIAGEIPMVDQM